ncbi:DUF6583 family protein [Virgibacillus oceani]|uniref:DUF945 domain-containing protein n=1 Tax=Virgibacillus oceani TaxID=1479511 RepID=A0A917GZ17_9BACI|nr:DUF6583 family protein [Virgibacillus oceani]GGG62088.1 hypothetical protein GCM10011398_01720 [Virgibacillus oceani]
MTGKFNGGVKKKGISKKVFAIIIIVLAVIGGSVSAYVLLTGSAKTQYFKAEKNTIDFMVDKVKERYEPEVNWLEHTEDNPTETALELSAEANIPGSGYGMISPQEIINNSTITLTTQMDKKEKQIASDIKASFGEMELGDISFFMTADKVMLGLPFLKETLQINDKDLGKLLKEIDPATFSGEEEIDFNSVFEAMEGTISEEDQAYFKEEYITMIYDKLPDDAFETTKETVKVDTENVKTEKITFHLSEQQVKDLITAILEKMKDDKRLKEIIKEQMELQQFGMPAAIIGNQMALDTEQMIEEFDSSIDDAIKGLEDFQIPHGLTSIIWVNNDLIVKRDFSISMGPTKDELATITVNGTHLLSDSEQMFDYEFGIGVGDAVNKETMTIAGDLTWKDNKADDSIKLTAGDVELSYESTETLEDNNREFERVFSFTDQVNSGSLTWSGEASYDNDQMNSDSMFSIEASNFSQDIFNLHVAKDAKTIKKVDVPNESNVKNLGSMSMNEIMQYAETEATPQFQQWLMGLLGTSGGFGF